MCLMPSARVCLNQTQPLTWVTEKMEVLPTLGLARAARPMPWFRAWLVLFEGFALSVAGTQWATDRTYVDELRFHDTGWSKN